MCDKFYIDNITLLIFLAVLIKYKDNSEFIIKNSEYCPYLWSDLEHLLSAISSYIKNNNKECINFKGNDKEFLLKINSDEDANFVRNYLIEYINSYKKGNIKKYDIQTEKRINITSLKSYLSEFKTFLNQNIKQDFNKFVLYGTDYIYAILSLYLKKIIDIKDIKFDFSKENNIIPNQKSSMFALNASDIEYCQQTDFDEVQFILDLSKLRQPKVIRLKKEYEKVFSKSDKGLIIDAGLKYFHGDDTLSFEYVDDYYSRKKAKNDKYYKKLRQTNISNLNKKYREYKKQESNKELNIIKYDKVNQEFKITKNIVELLILDAFSFS